MAEKTGKILIVTDYFYPHWTGLSKSLYYFLQALGKELQTTVLTVRFEKKLPKREQLFESTIYREDPLFTFSRAKYSLALLWRFILLVRRHETVFVNSPNTNIFPLAILTKLFRKKLYIFHQGDLLLPKGASNRLLEVAFDVSTLPAFALADRVSTYTQDYAEHSRVLRPFLRKHTPLLFPLPSFFSPEKRKKHPGVRFGFAGRFVEEKGFDILLKAIPAIVAAIPDAEFFYAGELHMGYENFFDQHSADYERVKDHVRLLGLLDESALRDFYRSIDFLIVPSRSDCFNLVQAEAMLCGTPVIASNIPGLRYLVKETGFGLLFEKENVDDLADTVRQAVAKQTSIMLSYSNVFRILDRDTNVKKIRDFITT